ncbi:MAG: hypothetical protein Q8M18_21935 [Bradyrhizobium sp.]|nr:hypothetical protein [Bradyrhizobium sp.]
MLSASKFPEAHAAARVVNSIRRDRQASRFAGLARTSRKCCAIIRQRFDVFLTPPSTKKPGCTAAS